MEKSQVAEAMSDGVRVPVFHRADFSLAKIFAGGVVEGYFLRQRRAGPETLPRNGTVGTGA